MGALLRAALRRWPCGPLASVRRFSRDPVGVQARVLRALLTRAAGTEWGVRLGFAEILRAPDLVAAYQASVPLHRYQAFHEDHMRVLRGARNVCWPGEVRYVATTAGTTSRGRVLPASEESFRHDLRFARGVILNYLAETGRAECLRGTMLSLPGRVESQAEYPGLLIGDMTGCLAHYCLSRGPVRRLIARRRIPPELARQAADYDAKATAIADWALGRDVRMLCMMPSWGLALVERVLQLASERAGREVKTLAEIWPRLTLVMTGGVPLAPYRRMLEQRIGLKHVDFLEIYSASEASFAFQSSRADPALLLSLDNGVFYEFVPFADKDLPHPPRLTVADVQPGVPYLMVVTTSSGLWSYHMEDVVRFTRVYPHKLEVIGRAGELLDNVGEFLLAEEVRGAVRHASDAASAEVREFHVAPRPAEPGRPHAHQWLVEFDRQPPSVDQFAAALDEYLMHASSSYGATREKQGLGPPEIVPLPPGTFRQWLKQYRSHVIGQTKVPRMSETRQVADTVLALVPEAHLAGTVGPHA